MIWRTVDFFNILLWNIPGDLRLRALVDYLFSIAKALDKIYSATLYKMQHNSQVIYLEKMLNEWFLIEGYDPNNHVATRQIIISDAPQPIGNYIYQPEENQPLYIFRRQENQPVFLRGGGSQIAYQFVVQIPSTLIFEEVKLRAQINYFKLAGKKYIIETYDL